MKDNYKSVFTELHRKGIFKFLLVIVLLSNTFAQAQETYNTIPNDENCLNDGSIGLEIRGLQQLDASIQLELFDSTSTSVFIDSSGLVPTEVMPGVFEFDYSFPNLGADTYSISIGIAYGSPLATTVNQTLTNVVVVNTYTPMMLSLADEDSCAGTLVTAMVTDGVPPYSYELLNVGTLTPVAPANFTNPNPNEFDINTAGNYIVRVSDACLSQTITQGVTATVLPPRTYAVNRQNEINDIVTCGKFGINPIVQVRFGTGNSVQIPQFLYPITVDYTITSPTLGTFTDQKTWNSAGDQSSQIVEIDLHLNEIYTVAITLTDACGDVFTLPQYTENTAPRYELSTNREACGFNLAIKNISYFPVGTLTVHLDSYPVGFDPLASGFDASGNKTIMNGPDDSTDNIIIAGSAISPVPEGSYQITVTDANCSPAAQFQDSVTVDPFLPQVSVFRRPSCEPDEGSMAIRYGASLVINTASIVSAPQAFYDKFNGGTVIPVYDISANIESPPNSATISVVSMKGLPVGDYIVRANTDCGPFDHPFNIPPREFSYNSNVSLNCGSFNVDFESTTNQGDYSIFLQKFFPASNQWGHPITGVLYNEDETNIINRGIRLISENNNTGISSTRSTIENNIGATGKMRFILQYHSFDNGSPVIDAIYCDNILEEFTVPTNGIIFSDYFVTSCTTGGSSLFFDVISVDPVFKLLSFNGAPLNGGAGMLSGNSGTDPFFQNLDSGLYDVEISNSCGNSATFSVNVGAIKLPVIRPSNLCDTENGFLFLTGLSLFNVEWFLDNTSTGVMGNRLNFTPFDSATDLGTYKAVITPSPTGCDPLEVEFVLPTSSVTTPNAGTGGSYIIDISTLTSAGINLFDFLDLGGDTSYQTFGTWTETTANSSGLLFGSIWNANLENAGVYTFDYDVTGTCSGTDKATLTLTLEANTVVEYMRNGKFFRSSQQQPMEFGRIQN